jgi:hypothetical protein
MVRVNEIKNCTYLYSLLNIGSNNDAGILKAILSSLPPNCEYFADGDHCVMDRGFRDAIITLESEAHQNVTHMPQLLAAKQKAFTAAQGNESRRVTLIRWVVEAVNGRIKRKFRLFRNVVPGGYLEKTGTFFKIACAIINRFSPPLSQNSARNDKIAEKALELMAKENELEKRVNDERLDRNTKT